MATKKPTIRKTTLVKKAPRNSNVKMRMDDEPEVLVKPRAGWAKFDDDEGILIEAKRMYARNLSDDDENRSLGKEDMEFIEDPWTEEALNQRLGKACLNADPLSQFRTKVKNEFAKLEPGIKVRPFDSFADVRTAEKIAGLVRHVCDISRAQRVFNHTQGQMVDSGMGFYRVTYEWASDESFEKEIYIRRIQNRFCVVPGRFQEPDASDMVTCFVVDSAPREDYEGTKAAGHNWDLADESLKPWHDNDCITVAEYWRVITKPDELCLMSNGMKLFRSVIKSEEGKERLAAVNDALREQRKPIIRVIKSRPVQRRYVQCFKLTAFDVLERHEWPGNWIPIIPFLGNEMVRPDGTVLYYGMTRYSKDQVRMINYFWSEEVEMVALQPKAPHVGTAEQFEGHEDEWDSVAEGRSERVTYNPHVIETSGGPLLVPMPQRQAPPQIANAQIQSRIGAMELLKGANGVYASGLGDQGPELSGRAIMAQKSNSDTATFHYIDSPGIGIQHGARIVIDLMRKVYTAATVRRVLGEDGTEEMVPFNTPVTDESGEPVMGADGKMEIWDLSVGEYDVVVEMGPAYSTQRQEALAALNDVLKVLPPDRQAVIADLVVGNIDAKDMDKAAARLKAMIPPELLKGEADQGEANETDRLAQAEQQLQQAQAQIQQMQALGQELKAALEKAMKKAEDKDAELQLKWKQSLLDAEVKLAVADKSKEVEEMKSKIEVLKLAAGAEKKAPRAKGKKKSEANPGNGEPAKSGEEE